MVWMDDGWSEWMIHDPDGSGWLRNSWEWLEMACTPRQIFSESDNHRKSVCVEGLECHFHMF